MNFMLDVHVKVKKFRRTFYQFEEYSWEINSKKKKFLFVIVQ